jgi:hypothetical protein
MGEFMRIMGLDYGAKTVGVAISDEMLLTAQPIETIRRERPAKLRQTLARIESIMILIRLLSVCLKNSIMRRVTAAKRRESLARWWREEVVLRLSIRMRGLRPFRLTMYLLREEFVKRTESSILTRWRHH